ncbi:MAG TPA: hypothetical protein VJ725_27920 [Thermoanaerobaculia bacterium]|nr:hypothetical protein [Thermoanaerobaculia bacterium]
MKTFATVFILLVALVSGVPCTAETTPAAAPSTDEFLTTLSASPGADVLPPAPTLLSTVCTSSADCPTGQLCCYPCGIDGCNFVCMTPVRNRCPFFP